MNISRKDHNYNFYDNFNLQMMIKDLVKDQSTNHII